jgi:hypothetical protein
MAGGRTRRCAALLAAITWVAGPAAAGPQAGPPREAAGRRDEAIAHFDKGLALYDQGAWAAALAEFHEAGRLYPLRNAVYQAGLCLEKLQQYDEALERFEAALRDFGATMPAAVKDLVERKVVEMRGLVGEVTVEGAEPGATISIDGRRRGEHPLLIPLRVAAGRHLVRVEKTGYQPFEAQILVAGGLSSRVTAHLEQDPRSPLVERTPRFTAELTVGVPLLATFYGQVGNSCTGACQSSLGITGYAVARGGYELRSRLAFGIAAGALTTGQHFAQRDTNVAAAGSRALTCPAIADDRVWVHAALAGAFSQLTFGDRPAFHFRLGAGAIVGAGSDTRQGRSLDCAPATLAPATVSSPLHAAYLAPEARVGLAIGRRVELSLGFDLLVAFNVSPPSFSGIHGGLEWNPPSGTETFSSPRLVVFVPVVDARYDL